MCALALGRVAAGSEQGFACPHIEAGARMRRAGDAPRLVGHHDYTAGVEDADFSRQGVERAERDAIRTAQRALRFGQQVGTAVVEIHDGVDLTCIERLELGRARNQPPNPGPECNLTPVWCQRRAGGSRRVDHFAGASCTPSAASTLPVSLRLPMTLAPGEGDSLARLGVTRMPSSSARRGYSQTSTISSL